MSFKVLARVSHRDRVVTVEIGRQTKKSVQRDACPSGKRFDAGCRPISAAPITAYRGVAPGGTPASSKTSSVARGYAFRPSPSGSDPAWRDDGPILVRNSG